MLKYLMLKYSLVIQSLDIWILLDIIIYNLEIFFGEFA